MLARVWWKRKTVCNGNIGRSQSLFYFVPQEYNSQAGSSTGRVPEKNECLLSCLQCFWSLKKLDQLARIGVRDISGNAQKKIFFFPGPFPYGKQTKKTSNFPTHFPWWCTLNKSVHQRSICCIGEANDTTVL